MSDLRGQIMKLRRDYYPHNLCRDDVPMAYRMGYRDARHDAAELALKADACVAALRALLDRYTDLVSCGDCGNWNPDQEDQVIAARAALAAVGTA